MQRQDRSNSNGKRNVTIHVDYREKGRGDDRVLQKWQLRGGPASMTSFGGTSRDKSKHGSWQNSTRAGDAAAVLYLVGGCCSRDNTKVLLPRPDGTRRPEGGIWN